MQYSIMRQSAGVGQPFAVLTARMQGDRVQSIMGENTVTFQCDVRQFSLLRIGDYVNVFGETYWLNRQPTVKKENARSSYSIVFESVQYELGKVLLLMLGDDNTFKEPTFSLTGTLYDFARLVVQNANRAQTGWTLGNVDVTEVRTLSFQNENCLMALSKIAAEFETEFWIDGKTLHLSTTGEESGLQFEYGYNQGLYMVTRKQREGANIITRLYAYGGTQNIPADYRNYSNQLLLPVSVGKTYLEKNVDLYGVIEHAETFDVWPHRTGTVTFASATDPLKFRDTSMPFDLLQQLLPGESAKVTFNSGQMGGYTFELSGYDHTTKTFTLLPIEDESGNVLPNQHLRPSSGDEYVLVDILMPQAYIDAAEDELLQRAQQYLDRNAWDRLSYEVDCDPNYFRRNQVRPVLGSYVEVYDDELDISVSLRIIKITQDVSNAHRYRLDLAEKFTIPAIVRQYAEQDKIKKAVLTGVKIPRPSTVIELPGVDYPRPIKWNPLDGPAPTMPDGNTVDLSPVPQTVPKGLIAVWFQDVAKIPRGWKLCDGQHGTPDMRGRFLLAAGGNVAGRYAPGTIERGLGMTGGEEETKLLEEHLPRFQLSFPIGEMFSDMNESGAKGGGFRDTRAGVWKDIPTNYIGGDIHHNNMPPFLAVHFIQFVG